MVWLKSRIYCATSARWEYGWREGARLTTCPIDAGHTVRSTQEMAVVAKARRVGGGGGTYTINSGHNFYACSSSGGNATITIPAAGDHAGRALVFVKIDADNTVTLVATGGDTIGDGVATTYAMTEQYEYVTVRSDGDSNWQLLGDDDVNIASGLDEQTVVNGRDEWEYVRSAALGVDGATPTAGAWTEFTLDSAPTSDGGANVSIPTTIAASGDEPAKGTNIRLEVGQYRLEVVSLFFRTEGTRMRLYNVSDSTAEFYSMSFYTMDTSQAGSTPVHMSGTVSIVGAAKEFRVQYRVERARAGGLGKASGAGGREVYTIVKISKLV